MERDANRANVTKNKQSTKIEKMNDLFLTHQIILFAIILL